MKKHIIILILATILSSCSSDDSSLNCFSPTAIVEVTNPITGKIWMDRNLGARRVAKSSTDTKSFGDLYQWGRGNDGHQCRNSSNTRTLSNTDQPAHGDFIVITGSEDRDWRSPQNDDLWQGVNGVNNPCPSGYRLPTEEEWTEERNSWSSNNSAGAFASPLKLPMATFREYVSVPQSNPGNGGAYWSSTVSTPTSRRLSFSESNASMGASHRAYGHPVRCIKD